jgi:hypothetical protein
MNKTFDTNGMLVQLDLNALKSVLGMAVVNAREALNDCEYKIRNDFEKSCFQTGDENYHSTCAANTSAGYLPRLAQNYTDAVKAYFYVSEAIKRDEVTFVK